MDKITFLDCRTFTSAGEEEVTAVSWRREFVPTGGPRAGKPAHSESTVYIPLAVFEAAVEKYQKGKG